MSSSQERMKGSFFSSLLVALIVAGVWLAGAGMIELSGKEILPEDVLRYAYESEHLDQPFGVASGGDHVPGYPIAIWMLRNMAMNRISIWTAMQIISLISLIGTTLLLFSAFRAYRYRYFWIVLFFVWPFVGVLRQSVYTADALIFLLMIAALLLYRVRRSWLFIGIVALAFLVHKVSWLFLGPVLLIGLWQRRLSWYQCLLACAPLLLLGFLGWSYYDNLLWLVANNIEHDNFSGLGVVLLWQQTFLAPTAQLVVKSVLITGLMATSVFLAVSTWRRERKPVETWVALAPAVLCLVMSWWAIFAAVRFSSMLVFSLADYIEKKPLAIPKWLRAGALLVCWILSLGFVYYAWFFFFD